MGNSLRARCRSSRDDEPLPSLDMKGIAARLKEAKHVVVLLGAGASTSCGIPDFRSPGSGLYSNLQKYKIPRPEAMFDIDFFRTNPAPFYDLVKEELWPGKYKPAPTHFFVRLLHEKGILQRCYTQNIDSLESLAGVPADRLVAAHGNFDSCTVVGRPSVTVPVEELKKAVNEGQSGWMKLRKTHGGYVKPSIVFFGENLPKRFFDLQDEDFDLCDLLIVIGTSLVVQPFCHLITRPRSSCPRLLINRVPVGLEADEELDGRDERRAESSMQGGFKFQQSGNKRDVFFQGMCDDGARQLARLAGWENDLKALIADYDAISVKH